MLYPDGEKLDFDKRLQATQVERYIAVHIPSFSAIPAFLRGTRRLASMPAPFRAQLMRAFTSLPDPIDAIGVREAGEIAMFMVWHRRFEADPRHLWVRRLLLETAAAYRG